MQGQEIERIGGLVAQGRYAEAAAACEAMLRVDPRCVEALQLLGVVRLACGQAAEGVMRLREALALAPDSFELWYGLGAAHQAAGDAPAAIEAYRRAAAVNPASPEVLNNLGMLLDESGRLAEAIECLSRALELRPDYVRALNNLGRALRRDRRAAAALATLERAQALAADNPITLTNLGLALLDLGRVEESRASLQRAVSLQPQLAEAHHALGRALVAAQSLPEGIRALERALQLKPDLIEAGLLLARTLIDTGRFPEAARAIDAVLRIDAGNAEAHFCTGLLAYMLGAQQQALAGFERALQANPHHSLARLMQARTLILGNELPQALELLESLTASGDDALAAAEQLNCCVKTCEWAGVERSLARLRAIPGGLKSTHPFQLLSVCDDPALPLASARWLAEGLARSHTALPPAAVHRRERIRIAYVSRDYCLHATTWLVAELFELHERSGFELYGVSYGPDDGSAVRRRIERACDQFFDATRCSDREIALWMRERGIDIAVDLKGYTGFARGGILAQRPAPIQVNYLGYPGTMGAPFIDYIVADEFVVPAAEQKFYQEKIAYLPDCYQVNDRQRAAADGAPSRSAAGLPPHGLVLCCFNNNWKITAEVFAIWMRLLRSVAGSVLWLLEDNPWAAASLRSAAREHGVGPERLIFCPRVSPPEHLARHALADLFLDTFPVNAHTTASDALWMGLPLVTCAGRGFAARVAGSLLRAIGLENLIAHSLEEYEQLALRLASDPAALTSARAALAAARDTAPLFDTPLYCRHLEAAYREMWQRACRGLPPATFTVPRFTHARVARASA